MLQPHALPHMTVLELKALREQGAPHVLVDVRENSEHSLCKIEGAVLIPLGKLPARIGELPRDRTIVVHCHHGGRSARAVQLLHESGWPKAVNLAGGIDAWSKHVDPSIPRY